MIDPAPRVRHKWWWISAITAIVCTGVAILAFWKTESKDLVKGINGYLIWSAPGDEIRALSLPELTQTRLRGGPLDEEFVPTIHALSGPDSEGRIVYIEDHYFVPNKADQKHLLKTMQVDGSGDTAIFSRPGDAMWATSGIGKGEIGHHLALAPTGGKVAFLSGLSSVSMPRAMFSEGTIEIWDVPKKTRLPLDATALDQPMSWFPDGKRLACARFVSRQQALDSGVEEEDFNRANWGGWDRLLAIFVIDTDTGHAQFFSLGHFPVVSSDGTTILVGSWVTDVSDAKNVRQEATGQQHQAQFQWKRVEITTGKATDLSGLLGYGPVVAIPVNDVVIYWGPRRPVNHWGIPGFAEASYEHKIKAAMINSGESQTLISEITQAHCVSFGRVLKK